MQTNIVSILQDEASGIACVDISQPKLAMLV
jgi:hypothetical protein